MIREFYNKNVILMSTDINIYIPPDILFLHLLLDTLYNLYLNPITQFIFQIYHLYKFTNSIVKLH